MRRHWRWAWVGGAVALAAVAAGLAFALINSGTDESDVAVGGSTSPTSRATASGSLPSPEPSQPAITPCTTGCGSSGIEGRVVQSPTCPVETYPPRPECAPRPYQATIVVWNADHSAQITKFTTDESGQFRVGLDPGDYDIEPLGEGQFPMPPPSFAVTVPPNQFVHLDIEYDTGIR